ncbi:MAG: alpha/beta hydrolase [Waterburya sp.]
MLPLNLSEVLPIICLLVSGIGLFLSLWIIIPAPTFSLLPLGVGAPEISPWLILLNAIALLLTIAQLKVSVFYDVAFMASLLGLLLSCLPLIQLPAANAKFAQEMAQVLGRDYLNKIPNSLQTQMRRHPFVLLDAFRGIPLQEVRIQRGVVFASPDGVDLKLNLYQPSVIGKYPAIIILYGGAWQQGTANNDEAFSRYMAGQGYSVIAIDYRHAPQYKFPAQLEDVQTALQYIQDNADQLEVDCDRLAIMGRSAGGHLAKLTAYQPDAIPFRAVVSYYGPSKLTEGYNEPPFPNPINTRAILHDFLAGAPLEIPEIYQKASPFSYVRPALPPSLLVYADKDHVVQAKFGDRLHQKLRSVGNPTIFLNIPWAEHAFDAVFFGVSNQVALYYTERFLAWALLIDRQI